MNPARRSLWPSAWPRLTRGQSAAAAGVLLLASTTRATIVLGPGWAVFDLAANVESGGRWWLTRVSMVLVVVAAWLWLRSRREPSAPDDVAGLQARWRGYPAPRPPSE